MSSTIRIRGASASDIATTIAIETAADRLLLERFGAVDWPPPANVDDRLHFHCTLVGVESALGLDRYGPRVQMTAELSSWRESSGDRP